MIHNAIADLMLSNDPCNHELADLQIMGQIEGFIEDEEYIEFAQKVLFAVYSDKRFFEYFLNIEEKFKTMALQTLRNPNGHYWPPVVPQLNPIPDIHPVAEVKLIIRFLLNNKELNSQQKLWDKDAIILDRIAKKHYEIDVAGTNPWVKLNNVKGWCPKSLSKGKSLKLIDAVLFRKRLILSTS